MWWCKSELNVVGCLILGLIHLLQKLYVRLFVFILGDIVQLGDEVTFRFNHLQAQVVSERLIDMK